MDFVRSTHICDNPCAADTDLVADVEAVEEELEQEEEDGMKLEAFNLKVRSDERRMGSQIQAHDSRHAKDTSSGLMPIGVGAAFCCNLLTLSIWS